MSRSSTRAAIQVSPPPPELERIPLVENQRGPGWITDKVAGIVEGKTPAWWWWAFIPSVVLMSLLLMRGTTESAWFNAVMVAVKLTIVLLVVGLSSYIEAEGNDRANVTLPQPQQDLVDAITAAVPASKLVLVVVAAGGVDTSYSAAGAAIHYNYPGEEASNEFPLTRLRPAREPLT